MRIQVDDSKRLERANRSHYYQPDACCVCGRELKQAHLKHVWLLLCRDNNGMVWALETPADADGLNCMGGGETPGLYVQPVGPECISKPQHKHLHEYIVRTAGSRDIEKT